MSAGAGEAGAVMMMSGQSELRGRYVREELSLSSAAAERRLLSAFTLWTPRALLSMFSPAGCAVSSAGGALRGGGAETLDVILVDSSRRYASLERFPLLMVLLRAIGSVALTIGILSEGIAELFEVVVFDSMAANDFILL